MLFINYRLMPSKAIKWESIQEEMEESMKELIDRKLMQEEIRVKAEEIGGEEGEMDLLYLPILL